MENPPKVNRTELYRAVEKRHILSKKHSLSDETLNRGSDSLWLLQIQFPMFLGTFAAFAYGGSENSDFIKNILICYFLNEGLKSLE